MSNNNHSTQPGPSGKPGKPYQEFPLTAHPAGYWCKKIRGKMHYFGKWDDPDGALKKYLEQKDALHAGRTPRPDGEGLTVKGLCNAFLSHKEALLGAGELSPRTWVEYKEAAKLLVGFFGKGRLVDDIGPDDFAGLRKKMAKRWGPTRLGNVMQWVRSVFKFAVDNGLVNRVVRYGQGFQRPSQKTLRLHRARRGVKLFAASEIRAMAEGALVVGADGPELVLADPQLRAMLLLGINAGYGMADCGQLPLSALDLDAGMIDFARPKTGIPRRCPLWPETVQAIRAALAKRPQPKRAEDAGLVFLTAQGRSWHKEDSSSPACFKVGKLLKRLGINGRKGLGFYTLRHTFRTVADEAKDQPAADLIMGHARDDMASAYREHIGDERLRAVADHVRTWLFPERAGRGGPVAGGNAAQAPPAG